MKKILFICFTALGMMFTSCDKEKTDYCNYYVRYEASIYAPYQEMTVAVNTESGMQTISVSSLNGYLGFSETYGPVSKGFNASITAFIEPGRPSTRIYVCRGEEPFVLKATGENKSEYVIDY